MRRRIVNIDRLCEFAYGAREDLDASRVYRASKRLRAQSVAVGLTEKERRIRCLLSEAMRHLARAIFRRREFHAKGRTAGFGRTQEIERNAHLLISDAIRAQEGL